MFRKIAIALCLAMVGAYLVCSLGIAADENLDDILKLIKAKVSDEVIVEHIAAKGMSFELSTEDILNLKKAGASDDLLTYMIKAGRDDFPFELEKDLVVKRPVVHKHLAIFPVFRKKVVEVADYITLDEAQESKVIVITEKGGGSVPTVVIKNIGGKPIYIMAGEVVVGGKQDRMISFDILIPASTEMEVSVKCVEHGRWHGRSMKFKSAEAVGSSNVRLALQFKGQGEVWSEVAEVAQKHGAETSSGTYKAVITSKDVEERSNPYLEVMKAGLKEKDMVGMIMALNGKVVCVDIFANPKFFAKVKDKLLKAYVLDAISVDIKNTTTPGENEILAFFEEMKEAKTSELKRYDSNCNFGLESEQIIGNASRDTDGNLQHLNLYKK